MAQHSVQPGEQLPMRPALPKQAAGLVVAIVRLRGMPALTNTQGSYSMLDGPLGTGVHTSTSE